MEPQRNSLLDLIQLLFSGGNGENRQTAGNISDCVEFIVLPLEDAMSSIGCCRC